MNDNRQDHPHLLPFDSSASDIDQLIGRIIDGEATIAQRQRFEGLAQQDVSLWKRLALRHQDMAMLATQVQPALDRADQTDLPTGGVVEPDLRLASASHAAGGDQILGTIAPSQRMGAWWLAASGWAAVVALAITWSAGILPDPTASEGGPNVVGARSTVFTPEQNLDAYMQAPYVLGDMPPTLLNVDELPDGRLAVSYLRRIVEVQYFDSAADIPLDEEGTLLLPQKHAASNPRAVPDSTGLPIAPR